MPHTGQREPTTGALCGVRTLSAGTSDVWEGVDMGSGARGGVLARFRWLARAGATANRRAARGQVLASRLQ